MIIDYLEEVLYSWPGPNLYFRGSTDDFFNLSNEIIKLIQKNDVSIKLSELKYIQMVSNCEVIFSSVEKSVELGKISGDTIYIRLDIEKWERLFILCVILSRDPGHFYLIEGEDGIEWDDIQQDCNIIWSSEG